MADETQTNQELELLGKWLKRYKASEDYCRDFFTAGQENYNLYKSYQTSSEKAYQHSIFVPYSFAYMEDLTSYFMLSILASPIVYSYYPRYEAVSEELCKELEAIVNWVTTEESTEFVLEVEELIKNANIFNVGYLINYPVIKTKSVIDLTGEMRNKNIFDWLHLDSPHSHYVFPEPDVKRLSRMRWVIKKSKESWEELKKAEADGDYKNVDFIKGGFGEDDPVKKMLTQIGYGSTEDFLYDEKSGKVELLDCMEDGHVITIGGRKGIIQDTTENGIRPFLYKFPILDCRTSGAPSEYFGIGLIESIKPTQKELNTLRSQRRDNISLILNKLFQYDMMAGEVDWSTFFSAPGNVIVTTNNDAIRELPVEDVTRSSFDESKELQYDLQNITSLWDYARGGTPRRRETATGIIRLQQAAQSRNEWNLRKVDAQILQPLGRRILVYLREYLSREDYTAIVGPMNHADEFYSLSIDQVKRMFGVMPLTESIVSVKEVDVNQFLQAFDRLMQLPPQIVNHAALVKQLLIKLGQKNIKEILPKFNSRTQDLIMQNMPNIPINQQTGQPAMGQPKGMPAPIGGVR